MRQDMHYLLVERGSKGGISRKGRIKQKLKLDPEYEGTGRLPMGRSRQYGSGKKWRDEYLAPLRRYLGKQVGRPWNDVYSEIRRIVKPDSTVRQHVYQHLEMEVDIHAKHLNLTSHWYRYGGLYVCPETGILKQKPRLPYQPYKRSPVTQLPLERDLWYELIDGQWYLLSIHRWIEKVPVYRKDKSGVKIRELEEQEFRQLYKKQANKKELKWIRDRIKKMEEKR